MGTLLHSWGGDTPPEAILALEDLVLMINNKLKIELKVPTEAEYYGNEEEHELFREKVKKWKMLYIRSLKKKIKK